MGIKYKSTFGKERLQAIEEKLIGLKQELDEYFKTAHYENKRKKPGFFRRALTYLVLTGVAVFGIGYCTGVIDKDDVKEAYQVTQKFVKNVADKTAEFFSSESELEKKVRRGGENE